MTLDQILDKHLPDNGLCDRLKRANQERKRKIKADIEKVALIAYQLKSGGKPIPYPNTSVAHVGPDVAEVVLDEHQLEEVERKRIKLWESLHKAKS